MGIVLALALPVTWITQSVIASPPQHKTIVGGYPGWVENAGIAGALTDLEREFGGRVRYGHDFVDHRHGWEPIEGYDARLDAWASWVGQDNARRYTLSLPLLPGDSDGSGTPWTHPDAYDFGGLAAGKFNAHFEALATRLQARPALRNSIVRLGWEFNGSTWPWSPSEVPDGDVPRAVSDLRVGWTQTVSSMRRIAPDLQFEWCPALGYDALPGYSLTVLYPGDAVVDYIGVGAYDYALGQRGLTEQQRWKVNLTRPNGLEETAAFAAKHDKPLVRTEWGLWPRSGHAGQEGGGDSAYYIEATIHWFSQHKVEYSIYNNASPHSLAAYPEARRRYRELCEAGQLSFPAREDS